MNANPREGRVLVTGASGFVGRALVSRLIADRRQIRAAVRTAGGDWPANVETIAGVRLDEDFDWLPALKDVTGVVHTAARVHQMRDVSADAEAAFHRVNVEGTLRLARQAAAAGVRRFVFLSSIKVNGEQTTTGRPFTPDDAPAPQDAYGRSKAEAERGLRTIAADTGLEIVIIRPVLVYGPGVKANFLSLLRWLHRGLPLPLGAIDNRRSLVGLDNLVDLIVTCLDHPAAAGHVFLVSDDEDLSTSDLLRRMGVALGRPARLLPIPPALIAGAAAIAGKRDVATRLLGSLQVDLSQTRRILGWSPPVGVDAGLAKTAASFRRAEGA